MQAARVMSLDPRSRMLDNVSDILEKVVAQIFRQPARGRLYFRDHILRHPPCRSKSLNNVTLASGFN